MTEIKTLTLLELRSLFGINKYFHTKDKKAKNRYRGLAFAWGVLLLIVFFYVGALVYGYCSLGLESIVPAYLVVISALLILFFGIFTAGHRMFRREGYEMLTSMPLNPKAIVVSRFAALYVEDLLLTLVIMIPGIASLQTFGQRDSGLCLILLASICFIPAIPLMISVLLGTVVMAVSSRMKYKSMIQTILMILLVVGIVVGSFQMENIEANVTLEQISEMAGAISILLGELYPPAMWIGNGEILLFILVSLGSMAATVFIVSNYFHSIMRRLMTFSAKHTYKIGEMESRSLLKTLYIREAKRYFSSSIYVTNTIIGPIMGCIMSIGLCVVGIDSILAEIPFEINVNGLLPFVLSGVFCMITTTSTSISMEGKQFWVIRSLPISAKTLFDSKILLNLSLMAPFYVISVVCLIIAGSPNLIEMLWFIMIPLLVILFSVVFGITVNLKFHSFDWEKEEVVVKQSLSSSLGGFAGMLLSLLLGGITFIVPIWMGNIVRVIMCVLLILGTCFLYDRNNKAKLETL